MRPNIDGRLQLATASSQAAWSALIYQYSQTSSKAYDAASTISMMEYKVTMPDERTPLVTTVAVGTPRRRYPHQVVRRFCTIALGSSLVVLFITFLVTTISAPPPSHTHPWPGHGKPRLGFEELQSILLDTPTAEKASEWSKYYTSGAHLAGQNLSQVRPPRSGQTAAMRQGV